MYLKFLDDTYVNGVLTFKKDEIVKFDSVASYNRWLARNKAVEVIPAPETKAELEEEVEKVETESVKASKKNKKKHEKIEDEVEPTAAE